MPKLRVPATAKKGIGIPPGAPAPKISLRSIFSATRGPPFPFLACVPQFWHKL